jgi:hypothetical protein
MLKTYLFWETFFLLAAVGVIHYIAQTYNLYWSVYEFDSFVHFLAGMTVSLFFSWLYFFSGFFNPPDRNLLNFLIVSVVGTIFIGISWETFELLIGEALMQKAAYPYDTMMDLIMDFLGATTACFYGFMREQELESKEAQV